MAAVSLGPAILCLADDPTQRVAAFTSGWSEQTERDVSVRTMANGRRRVVRRAGSSRTLSWTMRLLTKEQVETAKSFAGQVVMIRDRQGRKEYGVFPGVSVVDYPAGEVHDVAFSLQSVTYAEV